MTELNRRQQFPQEQPHRLVLSYIGIHRAIGISGLLLPVLLGAGGLLMGIEIQDSISRDYQTRLGDLFVGTLSAIGIFLLGYRGHGHVENWTANLGCVSALGVALFPLDVGSNRVIQKSVVGYMHTFSGGVVFDFCFLYLVELSRTPERNPLRAATLLGPAYVVVHNGRSEPKAQPLGLSVACDPRVPLSRFGL